MAIFNTVYGGEGKWKPGANTLAYYKFENDLNDSSGNGRNLTVEVGSFSYGTTDNGAKYVQTNNSSYSSLISSFPFSMGAYTISLYANFGIMTPYYSSTYQPTLFDFNGSGLFRLYQASTSSTKIQITDHSTLNYTPTANTWNLYTFVCDGTNVILYVNGTQIATTPIWSISSTPGFRFNTVTGASYDLRRWGATYKCSEFIVENKARTADEISAYYDQTKSNYGL